MAERRHVRAALTRAEDDRIVFDLTGIESQYDALRRELPGVVVRFAMKACPVDEVLACLAERGAGFDAASPGEIRQALRTGVSPRDVHYGNTVKSDAEIAAAHRLGVTTFATDCVEDVRAIACHAPGARVFCRVATTGEGALWGLVDKHGSHDPVSVLAEARRRGLVPAGLAFHVGSQQMTVRAWQQALDGLTTVLPRLESRGIRLDHVNLGGGLPARGYFARKGSRLAPPSAEIFAAIRAGMQRLRDASGHDLAFVAEPGRHLVADHGTIRAHVARLTVRHERWLYLSCGKFNGLYETDQLRYRLTFPTRTGGRAVPAVVAGPTCDSDDRFGGGPVSVPADLVSGDPVWIHSAGAYSTSYTTQGFNGYAPLPCVTVRAERVRPISAEDWTGIAALEARAYGGRGLSESRPVLESRGRSSPVTSFVLDAGDRVGGYLLALPYPRFRFPDPARAEDTVFRSPNLHLHDIVVGDELRGRGWAKRLLRHLTETARSFRYERISLIAVGGTTGFWAAQGYRAHPEVAVPAGYGPDAVYMSREIAGATENPRAA
ncbi:GNAT family N-acetyltransferase [Amycolatopsis kentuckyensis]|uniref:GNAT family N-acetyltransferase n=1 Tax=Amycolatopsis kentuckyensis TaxID=218823 RepID=UPI00356828EF